MTTENIAKTLLCKGRTPDDSALRITLISMLYKEGYKTQHIASALHIHRTSIPYAIQKTQNLIDIDDPLIRLSMEEWKRHSVRLVPYFEKTDALYAIKAHIEIDNVKLVN